MADSKTDTGRTRYVLKPCDGGYRIERLRADTDFKPPLWVSFGYLNEGRVFPTRSAARDYMVSEVER